MDETKQIRSCPKCGCEESHTSMNKKWHYCDGCTFLCYEEDWDALPRREDFHADVVGLQGMLNMFPHEYRLIYSTLDKLRDKYAPPRAKWRPDIVEWKCTCGRIIPREYKRCYACGTDAPVVPEEGEG